MAAQDLGTASGAGDDGSSQLQDAAPSLSQYDLLSTQFKAPEFIAFAGPLTDRTALDYFSQSPFYDKRCTNQMLRMQNIAAFASTIGRWSAREEEEQLRRFVGIEYVVANAQPPALFVIHRRERVSETEAYVQAAYYIINDAIMQAPDLLTMLGNRLVSLLSSALCMLSSSEADMLTHSLPAPPSTRPRTIEAHGHALHRQLARPRAQGAPSARPARIRRGRSGLEGLPADGRRGRRGERRSYCRCRRCSRRGSGSSGCWGRVRRRHHG